MSSEGRLTHSGLVDQILDQCARGKAVKGAPRSWPRPQRAALGESAGELVTGLALGLGDGAGVGLGEDRAEVRGHHVVVPLADVGEQVAGESKLGTAGVPLPGRTA